jgi:hypothetical protein
MRITRNRVVAAAAAAAIALTSMVATPAAASPYRYHRGPGNAAVLGAIAGVFGTIAALAARDHYVRHYGYAPYYYGPYAPPPPPAPYGYGYPYPY